MPAKARLSTIVGVRRIAGRTSVEAEEYVQLAKQEETLWWFTALHNNIFALLDRFHVAGRDVRLIDLGSGTGGFIGKLRRRYPDWTITGLDKSMPAVTFAAEHYGCGFVVGNVDRLPFRDSCADIVVSADVLYHRDVNQDSMLREALRILKQDGLLILNNPAYNWLFSYHDRFVHAARRYTKRRMVAALRDAGYKAIHVTYWNTILFPLMVLKRKILSWGASKSDVHDISPTLNALFSKLVLPETWLLRRGLTLPFGGSVLALARKG
jgi:SAM-dependent methyltransferase